MNFLKKTYKTIKIEFKIYRKVNLIKTICFNFRKFPYSIAKKLPVFFYGKVKIHKGGNIIIDGPVKRGMIGFGQPYEMNTVAKGTAEFKVLGTIVFKGHVQFGKDYFIYVAEDAYAEFGHMSSLASNGKIICTNRIVLGDYARIGSESQLIDTNFHQMFDTISGYKFPLSGEIKIGSYNYISNRVSIMQNTITPEYCTIASNSLCNKDYSLFGENILIGGIPAKLIRNNISRDWNTEKSLIDKWLIV